MSSKSAEPVTVIIDSIASLQPILGTVIQGQCAPPYLFLDLEGEELGRHGSLSIMSMYVPPIKTVYLIDIHKLGMRAFSTVNQTGTSLKSVLESSKIIKVLFDVRRDSDALFSHYRISLDGIRDVQLMELGTRIGSKDFLSSLTKCIQTDSTISATEEMAWERSKRHGRELFDPSLGGRYEILNARPIRPAIEKYCAGDVVLLPELFNIYNARLTRPGQKFWEVHVLEATKERIKLSQSQQFSPSETSACSPWDKESLEEAIDQWNDSILDDAYLSEDYGLDDDDGWVDDGPTSGRDIINDCDYEYYYSD